MQKSSKKYIPRFIDGLGEREKGIFVVKSVVSSQRLMGEKCRCVIYSQTTTLLKTELFLLHNISVNWNLTINEQCFQTRKILYEIKSGLYDF